MNGFHSIFIRYVHGYIFLMGKILSLSEIGGSNMEKVFCMCIFIKAFPKLFICVEIWTMVLLLLFIEMLCTLIKLIFFINHCSKRKIGIKRYFYLQQNKFISQHLSCFFFYKTIFATLKNLKIMIRYICY